MSKFGKIILAIFLVAVLGLSIWYLTKNNLFRKLIKKESVQKKLENVNLPGKLFGPKATARAEKLDPEQIIYWTNKYRSDNGLSSLRENDLLNQAAEVKVQDMFAKQYFEHNVIY